jgi:hypothetical protein
MSATLLNRVKAHIIDDGGLLGAYTVKFYRWSDADLNGDGSIALFRMSGTNGPSSHVIQWPDVSLYLLANPDAVLQADTDMLGVLQYLRADYTTTDAFNLHPVGTYTGPTYLDNGRAMFEMVIRTGVEDH